MVLERAYPVWKEWDDSGIGVHITEETLKTDEDNGMVFALLFVPSHHIYVGLRV